MARTAKPAASLQAIREELERVRREQDSAPPSEKPTLRIQIKVLKNCERLLVDFFGDRPPRRRRARGK